VSTTLKMIEKSLRDIMDGAKRHCMHKVQLYFVLSCFGAHYFLLGHSEARYQQPI
jgi:hypothetical protein